MKRYGVYFTTMEERPNGTYYSVEEVDRLLETVREHLRLGLESGGIMFAMLDMMEKKVVKYEKALNWMVNNPGAHPNNVVAVAKEALE